MGKTGFMPTKMGSPRLIINCLMILIFLVPYYMVVDLKQKITDPN